MEPQQQAGASNWSIPSAESPAGAAAVAANDDESHDNDSDKQVIVIRSLSGTFDPLNPRLSPRRWSILAGLCIFGLMSGVVNELTAILSTLTDLLGLRLDHYVYIQQAFSYIRPASALPCAWFADRYGLRNTMYLALLLSVVRNASRALLFTPQAKFWLELKFLYWSLAAAAESLVGMLYYSLPLKASESWFPKEERSLAWSCIFVAPILGSSLTSLVMPHFIQPGASNSLTLLAQENLVALAVGSVAVVLLINKSRPKHAPSERNSLQERSLKGAHFLANLKNLLSFRVLLHLATFCSFDAMISTINSLSQDILASAGFSQVFCGNFLASQSITMIVIQLCSSWQLDRRHRNQTHAQLSSGEHHRRQTGALKWMVLAQWACFMLLLATLGLGHRLAAQLGHQQRGWLMMAAFQLYTVCACWLAPNYTEMLKSLNLGRVSDATVSAFRMLLYYSLQNPYQAMFIFLRQADQSSESREINYSFSMLFVAVMLTSLTAAYLVCFTGPLTPSTGVSANDQKNNTNTNSNNNHHQGR